MGKKNTLYQKIVFYCWKQTLMVVGCFNYNNISANKEGKTNDKEILYHNIDYLNNMAGFTYPGWLVVNYLEELKTLMEHKMFMIANSNKRMQPLLYIVDPSKGQGDKLKPECGLFIPATDLADMMESMEDLKTVTAAPEDRKFTCYLRNVEYIQGAINTTSIVVPGKEIVVPIMSLYTEGGKDIGIDLKADEL